MPLVVCAISSRYCREKPAPSTRHVTAGEATVGARQLEAESNDWKHTQTHTHTHTHARTTAKRDKNTTTAATTKAAS